MAQNNMVQPRTRELKAERKECGSTEETGWQKKIKTNVNKNNTLTIHLPGHSCKMSSSLVIFQRKAICTPVNDELEPFAKLFRLKHWICVKRHLTN
jgi:hypothetical protein